MMKGLILLTTLVLIITFKGITYGNKGDISGCHDQIKPLHLERERVAQLDGMWGLFEKNRELQNNSVAAINLDRKVNSIIFHLEYLCETLNGIPMNEVARYVRDGINEYGEDNFRKELIILGKNEAEIKIWFEFTNFSLKNEERSLNLNTILALCAGGFLDQSPNAFFAFSTAKSTSALEAKLTSADCSPVAGLKTFDFFFEDPLLIFPSIKCSIEFIST